MIKNIFTKTRIKIFLIFLISFFAVKTMVPQIFLADSPRVNPEFIARLQNAPAEIGQMPGKMLASINNSLSNLNPFKIKQQTPTIDQLANAKVVTPQPNMIFKAISKGVSAAEDPQTGQKYIKIEAGTKYRIVGTVTINGKQYPKIEFIE